MINAVLAIVLAILWALFLSEDDFTPFSIIAALSLICLVAAPVDLIAGLIFLALDKKERAYGFLLSAALFGLILALSYLLIKS